MLLSVSPQVFFFFCDSVDQLSRQESVSEEMTAVFQSTYFSSVGALQCSALTVWCADLDVCCSFVPNCALPLCTRPDERSFIRR